MVIRHSDISVKKIYDDRKYIKRYSTPLFKEMELNNNNISLHTSISEWLKFKNYDSIKC